MFTGLVHEVGKIRSLARAGELTRIEIAAPRCAPGLAIGDSLAVNGICLTVTRRRGRTVDVEAAAETWRVTTLRRWRAGDRVHLEPALRAGDPLGGHLVLGHVDTVGTVLRNASAGKSWILSVGLPPEQAGYLLPKGSVAVDGISLTVDSGPFTDRFTVNVIPHTLAVTRLKQLRPGSRVNLEMDVLVKAARGEAELPGLAEPSAAKALTREFLFASGFRRRR